MVERRHTSLLDFAIAASIAVVPIMLGIMLLVAVIRPANPSAASWRGPAERYVNVRHVAALKTFEQAVVQRPATAHTAPTALEVLDGIPQCRREWVATWNPSQWLRGLGTQRHAAPSPAEHIATRLAEFDAALLRFSSRPNARVSHGVGFDAKRWFVAANKSLGAETETSEYPGQRFQVRCADLLTALDALSRADARMLERLAWRGTEGNATLARWRPEQQMEITASQVTRRNPWNGIAGCIYVGRHEEADDGLGNVAAPTHFVAGARSSQRRLCNMPAMSRARHVAATSHPSALAGEPGPADPVDDTRWMVPPSLHAMLQPLESLRQPSGSLYRLYTNADAASHDLPSGDRRGVNRIMLNGAAVDVGFSIDLTIAPSLQALAQKTAACYTGRHDVCRALELKRTEDKDRSIGQPLLEGAMVVSPRQGCLIASDAAT